jgi:hypothetical protein
MSYQLKYFSNYSGLNNKKFKIEIYQNITGTTLTAVEVKKTGEKPFIKKLNDINKIYDNIITNEATIVLQTAYNLQFINMYTADMQEYKVKHYVCDSNYNVVDTIFIGYLNSEVYSEPFTDLQNYDVSFTANDGFNVLKRIKFYDENNNVINSILSGWDIIKIIFNKIFISDIAHIYIGFTTYISGTTLTTTGTTLNNLYFNCNNFIDEDSKVLSCRDVLTAILQPLNGYCHIYNNNLYITDYNILATGTTYTFKTYSNTFVYSGLTAINLDLGLLSIKNLLGENLNYETIPGINSQKLTYSPYEQNTVISIKANFTNSATTTLYGSDNDSYKWREDTYLNDDTFNVTGITFCKKYGAGTQNNTDSEAMYYKLATTTTPYNDPTAKTMTFKYALPYLVSNSTYKLKIEMSALCNTKTYYKKNDEYGNANIKRFYIKMQMRIGNYILNKYGYWTLNSGLTYPDYSFTSLFFNNIQVDATHFWYEPINDQWITNVNNTNSEQGCIINLNSNLQGFLYIDILNNHTCGDENTTLYNYPLYFKSLKVTVLDENNNAISSEDITYSSTLNQLYENEGDEIKTICGTNVNNSITAKGTIYYKNTSNQYIPITTATREASTNYLEKLLLRSVQSNYEGSSVSFKCNLNSASTNLFGTFKYNQLPDPSILLFPVSYEIDYSNDEIEINFMQINKDSLKIN